MESEKKIRFVELRATGQSYDKIAKQLSVSKTTLIEWSREYCNEIKNAKALELERIREEYLLGREQRIRIAGAQLGQITEELLKRDLNEVPTHRLFDMQRKLVKEISENTDEMEFTEKISTTGIENLKNLSTEVVKWTG